MRRNETIVIEDRRVPNPENPSEEIVQSAGRDRGKTFILTEMPAVQADEWVTQAQFLIEQANRECKMLGVGEEENFRTLALLRALKDPSLAAWWDCVKYQHDPKHPPQAIVRGDGCQIEEISTINHLIMAVYELHTGFFSNEGQSILEQPSVVPTGSSPTRMSRPVSERSSPQSSRRFSS